MPGPIFIGIGKHCLFKFPAVYLYGIFRDVGKTDGFHFLFQHFAGLKFCFGTGRPVTKHWVGAELFHALRQRIRIIYIKVF